MTKKRRAGKVVVRTRKIIHKAILLLAVYGIIWVLWECGLPHTRRWFLNYGSFQNKIYNSSTIHHYPQELPADTEYIRYFYYTGWFDTKTGISFMLGKDEYEKQKESCLLPYLKDEEEYQMDQPPRIDAYGNNNSDARLKDEGIVYDEEITQDLLETENLDYLNNIFQGNAEDYRMLVCEKKGKTVPRYLYGVCCRDETNEIVMFAFKDNGFDR